MTEADCWLAVELADAGDPDAVLRTVRTETDPEFAGQEQGDVLVLHGEAFSFDEVDGALESVADHLDRLVYVGCAEGGGGVTRSKYFEDATDLDDPSEELESTPGHWWISHHFDYYAAKYDLDAAV